MSPQIESRSPTAPALPEASPRDREVQHVTLQLVEAYAFAEAHAVLGQRLQEMAETQRTHLERLFSDWSAQDPARRADFLTFAHHRRRLDLTSPPEK